MIKEFKIIFLKIVQILLLFSILSCNADREDFQGEKYGSINSGELTVYCEESVYNLLDSAISLYEQAYPKISLKKEIVTTREAMKLLLSGNADVVITARDYLKDEDSLMKTFNVVRPEMVAASDALVLYSRIDFPFDTLNDNDLVKYFSNEIKYSELFSSLLTEPIFVTNSTNSSEFSNISKLIMKDKTLNKFFKTFETSDSVQKFVENNQNSIGIGYLSQVFGNEKLKCLKIGFNDSTGRRILPQIVHQGFIVQSKYPYINKIRLYLKEGRQNRAFWFASFISKEQVVQKYFKDKGIVPEYAKFKLRQE